MRCTKSPLTCFIACALAPVAGVTLLSFACEVLPGTRGPLQDGVKPPDGLLRLGNTRGRLSASHNERFEPMSHVTYTVVEHDGGWAYKVGDVFSETFTTREAAHAGAARAAQEQRAPGQGGPIEYED